MYIWMFALCKTFFTMIFIFKRAENLFTSDWYLWYTSILTNLYRINETEYRLYSPGIFKNPFSVYIFYTCTLRSVLLGISKRSWISKWSNPKNFKMPVDSNMKTKGAWSLRHYFIVSIHRCCVTKISVYQNNV